MSTTHDSRGRHRQAARTIAIAAATATLAGAGAAIAADGGATPQTTKAAKGAAESVKQGPKSGAPGPLAENEPIVTQARAALQRLVADGAIDQAEADVVMRGVIAGSVDGDALVRDGKVASSHMPAITEALTEVKRANAPAAPPTTKADGESVKKGSKAGVPGPLAGNEPVVIQARAALGRLVADGAIEQAEADVVERDVIAGSVDAGALVRDGKVASAHVPAIREALTEVKRANEPSASATSAH